jgi:hypothetical protein
MTELPKRVLRDMTLASQMIVLRRGVCRLRGQRVAPHIGREGDNSGGDCEPRIYGKSTLRSGAVLETDAISNKR